MTEKPYDDIPGTFVFDADRAREGYWLNQFCISLRLQENRDAMKADPEAYMARFAMTSFAFMLVCVPLPVCQTTNGK